MASNLKDRLARAASGESALNFDATGRDEQQLTQLPVAAIEPDPNQPRNNLGNTTELSDSIRQHGLLQPIIVEAIEEGKRYRILAGHRRHRACQEAGMSFIPAVVRSVDQQTRLEIQIIENLQREDLNPIDEARAMQRLMTEFNLSQRDMAKRLGKSLGAVNEALRVLDLPEAIQAAVHELEKAAPAKSILLQVAKEADSTKQAALFEKALSGEFTSGSSRREKKKTAMRRPKSNERVFRLDDVTVVIRFGKKKATREACVDALKRALLGEEKESS